jgi:hypothetical protein
VRFRYCTVLHRDKTFGVNFGMTLTPATVHFFGTGVLACYG